MKMIILAIAVALALLSARVMTMEKYLVESCVDESLNVDTVTGSATRYRYNMCKE